MFNFLKKYKLQFDILAMLVFSFGAVIKFFIEHNQEKRNWNLFVGIVFSIMAIIKLVDVVEQIRKKAKVEKAE